MSLAVSLRWLLGALAWGTTSAAAAQAPPGWLRLPSARDAALYYPEAARLAGLEGVATIRCAIMGRGRIASLVDCVVVEESPAGHGFGAAAVAMAPLFQMRWNRRQGGEAVMTVPIRFKRPQEGPVKTLRSLEVRPGA